MPSRTSLLRSTSTSARLAPCKFAETDEKAQAKTPEELINPAVNGTLSILRAAKKNGDKVQRVVITSSFACKHLVLTQTETR